MASIHHIGRKSGSESSTPVVVRQVAGRFYVPLPFGDGTNWYRNAVAAGGVRVTWKGRDHRFTNPILVDFDTASHSFTRVMRAMMRTSGMAQFVRFDAVAERA